MTNRIKRWWHNFKLSALRNFGELVWWVTGLVFMIGGFFIVFLSLLPSYRPLSTLQEWLNYQIGFNGPLWVGGLFFLGLAFLISLLIDTVFALSHSRQIKTALFQRLNHQPYSDALQLIMDEAMKVPGPAVGNYLWLRHMISTYITHDLAPNEIPPELNRQHTRLIVKHIYRTSAIIGLVFTAFSTLRTFAYGLDRGALDQGLWNAVVTSVPHAMLGLSLCGLFLLIYTLITLGDQVREESRERVTLLYEMTDSTVAPAIQDAQYYEDTLGLHSLEDAQTQGSILSYRE